MHRLAFAGSAELRTRGILCFDLRAVASPKGQKNGKISQSFIKHRDGALIGCSKILLRRALGLPQCLGVTF
jgi:hypothetical protein